MLRIIASADMEAGTSVLAQLELERLLPLAERVREKKAQEL